MANFIHIYDTKYYLYFSDSKIHIFNLDLIYTLDLCSYMNPTQLS